ncbi:threonine/serine exporter family protein [Aquipuribacter sp. MA13-6]|uniref:threonine/serine exporter family protein n=1 Tax=unclassified Aquipuribacter TaxID=2635084 RepID=UPI003EEAA79C
MRALPAPSRVLLLAAPLLIALLVALLLGGAAPALASSPAPELQAPDGSGGSGGEQPEPDEPPDVAPAPPGADPGDDAPTAPTEPVEPVEPAQPTDDGTSTGTPGTAPAQEEVPTDRPEPTVVAPTDAPAATAGTDPGPAVDAEPTATTGEPVRLSPSSPALVSSNIPLGSVALAVVVLLVGGLLVRTVVRRGAEQPAPDPDGTAATVPLAAAPSAGRPEGPVGDDAPTDPATLDFLLALGEALVDAGDAINHVQETLEEVATVNGVHGVGIVVMPTALFISLPHQDGVQTEVSAAGASALRLDQVDEVFRIVDQARSGALSPSDGRVALARARATGPLFSPGQQLLGYVLFTLGLVLILQGGWLELLVGGGLGLLVGALHLASERFPSAYQPFLPVVAALGASAVVLSVARVLPELAVFPPLVAALVAFLPGALLTTAVLELSTGQIMSGSGRLAAGTLRLVLLALGILAGAQLVGVPGASIDNPATGAATVVATWTGVAVFGVGVVLFKGARWSSLPWIMLVLYVAYAGQVLGGLLFGSTLSAFFGALAMTPVAMIAARQPTGPPALVSFLPGFWLLVPGAVGLEGVTRFLDEDTAEGISSLVTMGTSMVGIALGVLLGLAVGGQVAQRLRIRREALSQVPA